MSDAPTTESTKPSKATFTLAVLITVAAAALVVGGIAGGVIGATTATAPLQTQLDAAEESASELSADLLIAEADVESAQKRATEAEATVDKLTADIDPVVLKIDFPMPSGYPVLADLSTVPEHMRDALDAGTGQVVAVAPGVWAAFPPGASVESAVNARAFDGYCSSKLEFETQYLGGESTSGSCW